MNANVSPSQLVIWIDPSLLRCPRCDARVARRCEVGTELMIDFLAGPDRTPRTLPVRVVRFSPPMLTCGVELRDVQGIPMRITSPARTVVDCFRYRNKVGLDVALEALRDTLATRRANVAEILRIAEAGLVRRVIAPYVEAATAS